MLVQASSGDRLDELTDDKLCEQIIAEIENWKVLVESLEQLVESKGRLTHQCRNGVRWDREHYLSNFSGFTIFTASCGRLEIWYHPDKECSSRDSVCRIYYPCGVMTGEGLIAEDFEILACDNLVDWKTPLQSILDEHKAMLEEKKRIAEAEWPKRQRELLAKEGRDSLLAQAQRLKIG